jgi:uroporphyrinogen-III synthase
MGRSFTPKPLRGKGADFMHVLVTRPLQDGEEIAARLAEMGHRALLAPLLTPHFLDGPEPDLREVQAILATSANGIRALIRRTARRDLPIFAVGPQTTQEARDAGFADIKNAGGDAKTLAEATARWTTPDKGALLHICGEEAPGTLADSLTGLGFLVRRAILYRVDAATALPPLTEQALRDGTLDAVQFFSPRSARVFCDLAAGLPTQKLVAFCISPVTAKALTLAFREVRVAAAPNQAALLALLE